MFSKKVLSSIFILGLAVTLAGAGTWAALTDTETSTGNAITAGTLDMKLSNGEDEYTNGVTVTWTSPEGFKPGDSFSKELRFTNIGTVDAHHLYFYPEGLTHRGGTGGVDLSNKIILTDVQGHFLRNYGLNIAPGLAWLTGNHDGILTLNEFCGKQYVAFSLFRPVLEAENKEDFGLLIKGKFAPSSDNRYQGASCTFNLRAVASQDSPTENYVLVNDEETASAPDTSQDNVDLPAEDIETQE